MKRLLILGALLLAPLGMGGCRIMAHAMVDAILDGPDHHHHCGHHHHRGRCRCGH